MSGQTVDLYVSIENLGMFPDAMQTTDAYIQKPVGINATGNMVKDFASMARFGTFFFNWVWWRLQHDHQKQDRKNKASPSPS